MADEQQVTTPETPDAGSGLERHRKQRLGIVISANTPKTVVVEVSRRVQHNQYGKHLNRRKRYAVHDLVGCAVGDHVRIEETRPLSKTKRWRVVEKLTKE